VEGWLFLPNRVAFDDIVSIDKINKGAKLKKLIPIYAAATATCMICDM